MPFNVSRRANSVEKEILVFPAGLDAVQSVVISASAAAQELPSAVTGRPGVLGLRAGTILQKVSGDSQNRYEPHDGVGDIEGILADNVFFYDASDASDTPVDMLFHGCVFNKDKIIDYETYKSDLEDALHTCRFESKEVPE